MSSIIATPLAAFVIILVVTALLAYLSSFISLRVGQRPAGSGTPYACGEEGYNPLAQPDYSQFFPFAFFFTIAHVATMIIMTTPLGGGAVLEIALFYLAAVVVGIFILLGRQQ